MLADHQGGERDQLRRCQLFEEAIRSERIVEVGGPG
jgi:hypothetical protein